jgi:hypothetical protein
MSLEISQPDVLCLWLGSVIRLVEAAEELEGHRLHGPCLEEEEGEEDQPWLREFWEM